MTESLEGPLRGPVVFAAPQPGALMGAAARGAEYLHRFAAQLADRYADAGGSSVAETAQDLTVAVLAAVDADDTQWRITASEFVNRLGSVHQMEVDDFTNGIDHRLEYTPTPDYEPVASGGDVRGMLAAWGRGIVGDYEARYERAGVEPFETISRDLLSDVMHRMGELDPAFDHHRFLGAQLARYQEVCEFNTPDDLWEGVACDDCTLIIANDDDTSIPDPAAHRAAMAARMAGLSQVVVGDAVEDFSTRACDCCSTQLAGARHTVTGTLTHPADPTRPELDDIPGGGVSVEEVLAELNATSVWDPPRAHDTAYPVVNEAALAAAEACLAAQASLNRAGDHTTLPVEAGGAYGRVKNATLDALSYAVQGRPYQGPPAVPDVIDDVYATAIESDTTLAAALEHHRAQYSAAGRNLAGEFVLVNSHGWKGPVPAPAERVFWAEGGFGCDPDKLGTKVFGRIVATGEECFIRRGDVARLATPDEIAAARAAHLLTTPNPAGPAVDAATPTPTTGPSPTPPAAVTPPPSTPSTSTAGSSVGSAGVGVPAPGRGPMTPGRIPGPGARGPALTGPA